MHMYPRMASIFAILALVALFTGISPAVSGPYTIYFESDRDGDYRIFSFDGASEVPASELGCRHPAITADGSMLFYTRIKDTLWGSFWNVYYLRNGEEYKLTTNEIYDELEPAISWDGSFVAFTTMRAGNLEIITLPMDDNDLQYRVTDNEKPDELPALATGEQWVYWTGRTGNHSYIFRAPGRGGDSERITTDGLAYEEHPSLSADGRYLVYASVVEEEEEVEEEVEEDVEEDVEDTLSSLDRLRLADSSKYPGMVSGGDLVEEDEEEMSQPVEESGSEGDDEEEDEVGQGNSDIWILEIASGTRTQLTSGPARDCNPSISADGSVIVFTSDRDGNLEIYRINRDGSGLTRITNNDAVDDYAIVR